MAKKQTTPSWEGFLNPVRLLTSEEIESDEESCDVCGATAHAVESIHTLNEVERQQPLSAFQSSDLRYTCGLHAPVDVPEHILDDIDVEFYVSMKRVLICPEKGWEKYFITCLRLQPPCLKRCRAIKGRLHVSLEQASAMIKRGQALYERREKEKADADTE